MDKDDPVVESPVQSKVFLDDLYPDPILPKRSRGSHAANGSRRAGKNGGANAHTQSNRKLEVDVSVVDADTVFRKMMVLAESHKACMSPLHLCRTRNLYCS